MLVAIFALEGLPAVQNLSMGMKMNVVQELRENMNFLVQASKIGSLVSGIVMFPGRSSHSDGSQQFGARDRCGTPRF